MRRKLFDLFRFASPDRQGVATLAHRHIYILPTRYGMFFGMLLATMLLGSVNYANNLGFLTTFLLGGLGLVAMLHTYRNQLGLRVAAGRCRPVFCGQNACFEVRLTNVRNVPRPGIRVQSEKSAWAFRDLDSRQTQLIKLYEPATKRGELAIGRLTVSTYYPLGLFKTWSYVELGVSCLVYPAPAPQSEPPPNHDCGSHQSGHKGTGSDDFLGTRPYRPGDPPRHIDWKALAREGGLLTRQFTGSAVNRLWLDWASLPEPDPEARLSLLCRAVLTVSERQQTYGLRLPGIEIPPASGRPHRQRCLEALARCKC